MIDNTGLLSALIYRSFNDNAYTSVFCADVKGAFDNVPLPQLIDSLRTHGLPDKVNRIIFQLLSKRAVFAVKAGRLTKPRTASLGLPQGDILSPLLYILYTSGLSNQFGPAIRVLQYADDICLVTSHRCAERARLITQDAANPLARVMSEKGIALAPLKSQWGTFSRKSNPPRLQPLLVQSSSVPVSHSIKFLGLIFDRKLLLAEHLRTVINRAQKRLNFMTSLAGMSWGSHPQVLLRTYKTLVRPILEFGAGVVDPGSKERWNQLERIPSAALRLALGLRKSSPIVAMQVEAAVSPISLRIKELAWRQIARWHGRRNNPSGGNARSKVGG